MHAPAIQTMAIGDPEPLIGWIIEARGRAQAQLHVTLFHHDVRVRPWVLGNRRSVADVLANSLRSSTANDPLPIDEQILRFRAEELSRVCGAQTGWGTLASSLARSILSV
jgi:hypothetical protein